MKNIDKIVNRFLAWQLPQDFAPDAGIAFIGPDKIYPRIENANKNLWPTGTNLFTAEQAKEMFLYCLGENYDQN